MKLAAVSRALASLVCLGASVFSSPANELPETLLTLEPNKAGQILAEHLRSGTPAERTEFKGQLRVRRDQSGFKSIPIVFRTDPGDPEWKAAYQTEAAPDRPAEKLVVVHAASQPNQYIYSRGDKTAKLNANEAFVPLAGSDFWLIDLGLDFFHWPSQRVLKGQMHQNRYTYVLESKLEKVPTNGYSRVVSWIDKEGGAPIKAEAYDTSGKLLKEFALTRLRKVEGQWRLREMEIRNVQTKSLTRIQFEFDEE